MESLSIGLSPSHLPKSPRFHKFTTPKSIFLSTSFDLNPNSVFHSPTSTRSPSKFTEKKTPPNKTLIRLSSNPPKNKNNPPILKTHHLSLFLLGFPFPVSCFASEASTVDISSNKINLEEILVSIDDFFNKYPFFVAGVVFIWLFVIPVTQEYLRKYKFISAIDAFKKLKEDPNAQLLDIRDRKTLRVLGSPNLKILDKSVVQVEFLGRDEEGFVKKVKENFKNPADTTVCILDNFDGDSLKVAELLFNNGFKEAYAIRGGVRGDNGWQEIQETLLPPSVHINPRKKKVKDEMTNGAINQQDEVTNEPSLVGKTEPTENGYANPSIQPNAFTRRGIRSSSPYTMYPDMKPPSSPTPSKPQK